MTAPVDEGAVIDEVRTRLLVGAPPEDLTGLPARAVRALRVAEAVGAPGIPALDAALAARDDDLARARAVHVATAQARAVAIALAALPVVAVTGLGALLDLDLWGFYRSPVGTLVGLAGIGLAAAGVGIAWRLVTRTGRRPRRGSHGTDEVADLLATAVTGGYGTAAALRIVADVVPDHAATLRRAALAIDLGDDPHLPRGFDRVATALRTSARWGAPVGPPLRRIAADLRADDLARALAAAERLPALLAFPTALCLLPSCVLLVGAPLIAEGVRAAAGT